MHEEARGACMQLQQASFSGDPFAFAPLCGYSCMQSPHLSFPASEHCAASTSSATATATASASSTNSSSSAQAAFTGGALKLKQIPNRALPKWPQNLINPQIPSGTKIEKIVIYF